MEASIVAWLDSVSGFAFRTSAALFVVVNVAAVGAFFAMRNRSLVQRWTSPWLAANLLLLGAGAGEWVSRSAGIDSPALPALLGFGGLAAGLLIMRVLANRLARKDEYRPRIVKILGKA